MFNVINKRDDVLDAADNDNTDDANKKSIKNQEDTFDVVEDDGDDSNTNKTTPLDGSGFFFDTLTLTYHFFFSCSHLWWGRCDFLIMVLSTNDS
jgi:hypothetical protein